MKKNEQNITKIVSMISITVILLSIVANINTIGKTAILVHSDLIILQVGTDDAVQLAVDTFRDTFPSTDAIEVVQIDSVQELLLTLQGTVSIPKILFGHGVKKGLYVKQEVVPWDLVKRYIIDFQRAFTPVMACYSGEVQKNYGGIPYEIDAEAAGILGAYIMDLELAGCSRIEENLISVAILKQKNLRNPLMIFRMNFTSVPAAELQVYTDRLKTLHEDSNLYFANVFKPSDFFTNSPNQNPYIVDLYFSGPSVEVESKGKKAPIQLKFQIVYAIDGYSFANTREEYEVGIPRLPSMDIIYQFDRYHGEAIFTALEVFLAIWVPNWTVPIFNINLKQLVLGRKLDDYSVGYVFELYVTEKFEELLSKGITLTSIEKILFTVLTLILVFEISISVLVGTNALIGFLFGLVPAAIFAAVTSTIFLIPIPDWYDYLFADKKYSPHNGFFDFLADVGEFSWPLVIKSSLERMITSDDDSDDIPNIVEYNLEILDSSSSDTDGDGYPDYWEMEHGFNSFDSSSPGEYKCVDTIRWGSDEITMSAHAIDRFDKMDIEVDGETEVSTNISAKWEHSETIDISSTHTVNITYSIQNASAPGEVYVPILSEVFTVVDSSVLGENPDDTDNDLLFDELETIYGTNELNDDSDNDGVDDGKEIFVYGTNPLDSDSDNDGLDDGDEVCTVTHFPNLSYRHEWDTDYDGTPNWFDIDSDNDGLNDSYEDTNANGEYDAGTDYSDFLDNDTDNDNVLDGFEDMIGINPADNDSDDDGFMDGFEILNHLDPKTTDAKDWAFHFWDDFCDNSEVNDGWTDISSQGSMRRGGLQTNSPYTNYEAESSEVTRVSNMAANLSCSKIVYWFQEESGTTAIDLRNNFNATITGALVNQTGKNDLAIAFDGNNDEVYAITNSALDVAYDDPFSTACLFKSDDTITSTEAIFSLRDGGSTDTLIYVWADSSGNVQWLIRADGNIVTVNEITSVEIDDGAWHHVLISYEGYPGKAKLIVDGTLVSTATCSSSGTFDINSISIGYDEYSGGQNYFDGLIDDFVFYHDCLENQSWLVETGDATIGQYADLDGITGFVTSWNLSSMRSSSPAQAIESATITLDYDSNFNWDSGDDIAIAVFDSYMDGNFLSDGCPDSRASYSVCTGLNISNMDITTGSNPTIDIVDLVDWWYLSSNSSILSLVFFPDPDNDISGIETLTFDQGSFDPKITVVTGDSVLRASSYGTGAAWHGPKWYTNFGCDIDDFEFTMLPYWQDTTNTRVGHIYISLWTGDNATGTELFQMIIYDHHAADDRAGVNFLDNGVSKWSLYDTTTFDNWYTEDSDNSSIIRNGSNVKFFVDGVQKVNYTGSTTAIRSMSILVEAHSTYSLPEKMGVRGVIFQGHSDDYDDDTLTTSQEQMCNGSIWNVDTDGDGMPDSWEYTYRSMLDAGVNDSASDPDSDNLTNLQEYELGTDPTVYTTDAEVLASSYTQKVTSRYTYTYTSKMYFNIIFSGYYVIDIDYNLYSYGWTGWSSLVNMQNVSYSYGFGQLRSDYIGEYGKDEVTNAKCRWRIYDSTGTTVISEYGEW